MATMSSMTVKPERKWRLLRKIRVSMSVAPVEVGFAEAGHAHRHRAAVTCHGHTAGAGDVLREAAWVVREFVLRRVERDAMTFVEIAGEHRLLDAVGLRDDRHAVARDPHVRALAALNGDGMRAHEVRDDLVTRGPHFRVTDGLRELREGDHGEDAHDDHHREQLDDRECKAIVAHEDSWVAR